MQKHCLLSRATESWLDHQREWPGLYNCFIGAV